VNAAAAAASAQRAIADVSRRRINAAAAAQAAQPQSTDLG
jgi:hypothetical protein